MPTVFRYKGYRFFFYSNEGYPPEPLHIHVIKSGCVAKFWLDPEVSVAKSYRMKSPELAMLSKVVKERSDLIREVWNEYFD